jgi:hypothetical protein
MTSENGYAMFVDYAHDFDLDGHLRSLQTVVNIIQVPAEISIRSGAASIPFSIFKDESPKTPYGHLLDLCLGFLLRNHGRCRSFEP